MRQRRLRHLVLAAAALGGWSCGKKPAPAAPSPPPPARPPVAVEGPVDPAAGEKQALYAKAAAVFKCFDADLAARHENPAFADYRNNPATELFVFHALFDSFGAFQADEASLCKRVVEEYRRAFLVAHQQRARAGNSGGFQAATPIDATPAFARASGNRSLLHMLEHDELTRAALREEMGGRVFPVFEAVGKSAQLSDLFRWTELRYHGQTDGHPPTHRQPEIASSKEAFAGILVASIIEFVRHAHAGAADNSAAIHLGIACHAIQDVVFYRGMTRQQLAGLTFLQGKDPAQPTAALRAEARRWTRQVIRTAREALANDAHWKRFLAQPAASPDDYALSVKRAFSDNTDVPIFGLRPLIEHWHSHLAFRRTPDATSTLEPGPAGLIVWEIAPLFARAREQLESNGLVLRSARTP
jgi:hypothetical protein